MTADIVQIPVEIMGKVYQVKCPAHEQTALQRAATYLDEKMRLLRDAGHDIGVERIAVMTALNMVHRLLKSEQDNHQQIDQLHQRLHELRDRVEQALAFVMPGEATSVE